MNIENELIDKNIYNICLSIHKLIKLDIEFLDINHKASFQLFNSKMPFGLDQSRNNSASFIFDYLKTISIKEFFHYIDTFQLSYLGIGYWENQDYKGAIIIGPFLSSIADDSFISKIIETNGLQLAHRLQLHQYYKTLTTFSLLEYSNLASLVVTLANSSFIQATPLFSENKEFIVNNKEKSELEDEKFYSEVELRYSMEKKFLNAVEKGLEKEALNLVKFFQFKIEHRVPNNPLRTRKNITYTFNTLLRIATERGGVSPVYIHNTSDKFSILIEKTSTLSELENLQRKMISEYCDLVKKRSTAGHSGVIQKAINYINLNFDSSISLNVIAEELDINPSQLARKFKKETNLTVTEFIQKKRIDEAKYLIRQDNLSITDIALMVGFENHNYFCTVFKKLTSMTPTEYLKKSL